MRISESGKFMPLKNWLTKALSKHGTLKNSGCTLKRSTISWQTVAGATTTDASKAVVTYADDSTHPKGVDLKMHVDSCINAANATREDMQSKIAVNREENLGHWLQQPL